jgi:hypothetical protein
MSTALDEQIMDLVVAKVATITTGNGYEQTVASASIFRASDSPTPAEIAVASCPAVQVRRLSKVTRFHLRGAEEFTLTLNLLCVVDASAADDDEAIQDLVNDVKKLVYANLLWNDGSSNLAARTWIVGETIHEAQVGEVTRTAIVTISIKARSSRSNPAAVKVV